MGTRIDDLDRLNACATVEAFSDAVTAISGTLGFDYWTYGLDLPVMEERSHQFLIGVYPVEWVRHYFAHDYVRLDPVIAHCQAHASPFGWSGVKAAQRGDCVQDVSRDRVFQDASEFGLNSGLAVPVHGLGCSWGFVAFASKVRRSGDDLREVYPWAHMLGHFIHEAGHRFAEVWGASNPVHMTARELECLHWVALGKTSWEIGRLLAVTERTVVFHVQNAARKLGVNSRQAAIARAIVLGLVNV